MRSVDANYIKGLLPKDLYALIGASEHWQQVHVGRSGDVCFRVRTLTGVDAYLKSHASSQRDYFFHENQVLKWLSQFVPVPEVLGSGENHHHKFLLCAALPGKDLAHWVGELAPEDIVRICAQSMRLLHQIPTVSCAFDQRLKAKVKRAKERANKGLIVLSDLDASRKGWAIEKLVQEIDRTIPNNEDIVFTHGDFCLPNLIVENLKLTGFIDLGRSGLADRHQDIALCLKSLKFNLGDSFKAQFLKHYGLIKELDESKIAFYDLLDEFF